MAQRKPKEREEAKPAAAVEAPTGETATGRAAMAALRPDPISRRAWIVVAVVVVLINVPLIHRFLLRGEQPAPLSLPYRDDFSDPATVEKNYWTSGGYWRVVNPGEKGELFSPGVKNNPLWLQARLPADVAVEFDARSESPEGDIKVEIFGDGLNHQSGYVLIHGGWNNRLSIIARLDEHGTPLNRLQEEARRAAQAMGLPSTSMVDTGVFQRDTRMRVEAAPFPVEIGRTYRWRIERKGNVLRWLIDGKPFMELDDPFPLAGEGHDRFGFSSWEAYLYFDDLVIQPL